ncbi:DNA methyltransferase [uncultured Thiodictyon sp.]|jgi:16S rRNA G966 N2-methylase RsmD|uniref:DNA methyltransferase n=1 Tax=uncultured Thiodictyon sp. TaxID=1846217 RepID=UPI0025DD2F6B|nr:DNA methyltransferase [uncultured Thiodictyon sp.]
MNDLFDGQIATVGGPVECLGQTFPSEQARREHFIDILRERLRDPEFRKIEGFPIGMDADILAMSDPPYYTACPNPFLEAFVAHYGRPYDPELAYRREPMTIDVSVGKTDPLYKAHGYHTKVPHLAIVPSILHYTEPGDLVLDGFAGSGMTGVAAQWCGAAPAAYRHQLEGEWKSQGKESPRWGARRVILNDLSPAATFIAANYNLPFDVGAFAAAGRQLLKELEQELGWMYETLHTDGKTKGRIEYTVWSEVFACPECAGQIDFIAEALDAETKRVRDSFPCPHCGADLNKDRLERVLESRIDPATGEPWQRVKFRPALISYVAQGQRREKRPDAQDLAVLERIEALPLPPRMPTVRFPIEAMYHGSRIAPKGFSNTHHFFLPRAGQALGALWRKAKDNPDDRIREILLFFVEQAIWGMSVLARYAPTHFSQVNQYLNGVYYVASQHSECSPWYILDGKLARLTSAFRAYRTTPGTAFIGTGTAARVPLSDNSIDYIFTDPPFGENIYYADLNFLVESWHRVFTDAGPEAIIDRFKHKALPEYQHLMQRCFAEYYRVLKPGRWMTVVFSNSKAAVWNAIQVALQQAGFVVAEVTALDKVQGSYRQVTSATAMKQDLVISAYKPNGGLEERFNRNGATPDSAWDFVRTHLRQLPSVKVTQGDFQELVHNVERDPRRIKDRLDAWFIRHDAMVPLSSPEFIAELAARFEMVDGMVFLPEQRVAYEQARSRIPQSKQAELFVSDERSAIDWLTRFLLKRPATRSEILPDYMPQIGAAKKKGEIIPELGQLLDDSFLCYDGAGEVPSQIHSYLSTNHKDLRGLAKDHPALVAKAQDRWYVPDPNKAQDLEKKREKALLKEFATYQAHTGRRLKEFRLEVLRAGFRAAWAAKDYRAIVALAAKIPEEALQEDEKLLLWYDQALTRLESET